MADKRRGGRRPDSVKEKGRPKPEETGEKPESRGKGPTDKDDKSGSVGKGEGQHKKGWLDDILEWATDTYMPDIAGFILAISPGWGRSLLKLLSSPPVAIGIARLTNLPGPIDDFRSRLQTELRRRLGEKPTEAERPRTEEERQLQPSHFLLLTVEEWKLAIATWHRLETESPERLPAFRQMLIGELVRRSRPGGKGDGKKQQGGRQGGQRQRQEASHGR